MFGQEEKVKNKEKKKAEKVIGEGLLIGKDGTIVKEINYEMLVKVSQDEVVMKKKEVEEKDETIEELEKHGAMTGDKVIVNKEEIKYMKNTIAEFKKVSSSDIADAKMVVMKNKAILIQIEHYNDMKKRCLELEKMVKELSAEEGVLVQLEDNRSWNWTC